MVKPTWAKLIDFDETLPTAVEELVRRREEHEQVEPRTALTSEPGREHRRE